MLTNQIKPKKINFCQCDVMEKKPLFDSSHKYQLTSAQPTMPIGTKTRLMSCKYSVKLVRLGQSEPSVNCSRTPKEATPPVTKNSPSKCSRSRNEKPPSFGAQNKFSKTSRACSTKVTFAYCAVQIRILHTERTTTQGKCPQFRERLQCGHLSPGTQKGRKLTSTIYELLVSQNLPQSASVGSKSCHANFFCYNSDSPL